MKLHIYEVIFKAFKFKSSIKTNTVIFKRDQEEGQEWETENS